MEDQYIANDLEQIKAISDPLRLRIFNALSKETMTTKQVAEVIGEPPTKLYRHVQVLEKVGLIKLVRTKKNRGTVEKYYEPIARNLNIDRKIFANLGREVMESAFYNMVNDVLQSTLHEVGQTIAEMHDDPDFPGATLAQKTIHTNPKKLKELKDQLDAWLKAFEEADDPDGEMDYRVTLVLYPGVSSDNKKSSEED